MRSPISLQPTDAMVRSFKKKRLTPTCKLLPAPKKNQKSEIEGFEQYDPNQSVSGRIMAADRSQFRKGGRP